MRLLERAGYDGPLHFDAHAYRNENADGVWDFAAGCMAHLPRAGRAGRALRLAARGPGGAGGRVDAGARRVASVDGGEADALKAEAEDLDALAERGYFNERLDQLLVEVLLGVR